LRAAQLQRPIIEGMKRLLPLVALWAAVFAAAPAAATINPTYTTLGSFYGSPAIGRVVQGIVVLGSADTYVTGGWTISPAQLGFQNSITQISFGTLSQPLGATATESAGVATVKLYQQGGTYGVSSVTATNTSATVTGLAGLTANTPIFCELNDAATGGGGSGTWTSTYAVSSCKYASATTFTVITTGAAPSGGGNFNYFLPTIPSEALSGLALASLAIPYIAYGQ
jgi:hypothetical protein